MRAVFRVAEFARVFASAVCVCVCVCADMAVFNPKQLPLVPFDGTRASPYRRTATANGRRSVSLAITADETSVLMQKNWNPAAAMRELVQNAVDAVRKATPHSGTEWLCIPCDTGSRFTLNGAYAGEWTFEDNKGSTSFFVLNVGLAMQPEAFLTGFTDKANDAGAGGGYGSGLKDAVRCLLREGWSSVRVYGHALPSATSHCAFKQFVVDARQRSKAAAADIFSSRVRLVPLALGAETQT